MNHARNASFGKVNAHIIGIVLKETVRRAMQSARNQLRDFEVAVKGKKEDGGDDYVTTVDKSVQTIYVRTLRECFPHIGIVAEEADLAVPSDRGYDGCFFTVDPIDGTSALKRKQSHGIGSMVSLVWRGKIVSAWVGDVMSQEVYGYRPGSAKVHRIRDWGISEHLTINPHQPLKSQYILLRDNPMEFNGVLAALIGNKFKNVEVSGGSIGISAARLWKGEVGAILLMPNTEKPWDTAPVIGISQKLGFVFLRMDALDGIFVLYNPPVTNVQYKRTHPIMIVHETRLPELIS